MANTTGTLTQAQLDAVNNGLGSIGTEGDLFYRDATGLQKLAKGTSGQTLKMGGSNAPEWVTVDAPSSTWTVINTAVASNSTSLTVTGIDSTYDTYAIAISDLINGGASGNSFCMRLGDSSGIDSASGDYSYDCEYTYDATHRHEYSSSSTRMVIGVLTGVYNVASAGFGGLYYLHRPKDGASKPILTGTHVGFASSGGNTIVGGKFFGARNAVIAVDRVQIYNGSLDTLTSGRMTLYGIAHA